MARITFKDQSGLRGALAALAAVPLLGAAEPTATPSREDLAKNNKMFLQGAVKALKWEQPAEPLKIVGPIYFVGTQGLGSYLFNTSEGLILMGTGTPASGPMIAASIRKLGFRPEDIKVIVTWHAHADHAGAIAYLKQLSGAQLAVMGGDVEAKRAQAAKTGAEAFVDPDGYVTYLAAQGKAFEDEVARELAAPPGDDGVRRGPASDRKP